MCMNRKQGKFSLDTICEIVSRVEKITLHVKKQQGLKLHEGHTETSDAAPGLDLGVPSTVSHGI